MTTTITVVLDDFTPTVIDGYSARRRGRNVLHPILGTSEVAVTLGESGMRAGTLSCVFPVESEAAGLVEALSAGVSASIASSERPSIDMDFVIDGDVTIALDETRSVWIVAFDWQEISA